MQTLLVFTHDICAGVMYFTQASSEFEWMPGLVKTKSYISSILVRREHQYRSAVVRVNNLLCMACLAENFVFMDLLKTDTA